MLEQAYKDAKEEGTFSRFAFPVFFFTPRSAIFNTLTFVLINEGDDNDDLAHKLLEVGRGMWLMMTSQASNDRDDDSVESGLHPGSSWPPRLPCLLSVNSSLLAQQVF